MAPSPENDNAPKAPDKGDKTKGEPVVASIDSKSQNLDPSVSGPENKVCRKAKREASVSRLDDIQLKDLLEEAINYKTPKDRVGKSKLFQNLLEKAEEDDRKARATSASGSESVRYYNTTATHRTRRRRAPSSISENLTHGGSLNNLAKEELYAAVNHLHRPTKTVSARQRQGGSLPCNVNAGITPSFDKQFFEEARRKMENKKAEYTSIDMESESLLEHDSLNQEYNDQSEIELVQPRIPRIPMKYTSRFNLEIGGSNGGSNVDDALMVSSLERSSDKITDEMSYKPVETISAQSHYPSAHYSLFMPNPIWPFNKKSVEDKKVDENGNAVGQNYSDTKKNKKKKIQTDKNVDVFTAKDVVGHRSDIINDVDKLMEFIGGNEEQSGAKSKSNVHKTKFHKHQFTSGSDDKNTNKKQRARTKCKTEKIQKSNSMEEISISKLNDFTFSQECDNTNKTLLRGTKSNSERPRERRSWGNSESLPLHASAENLETADFRVVTKKKKSKKRRNSLSGRRQTYACDVHDSDFNRISSPEPRGKSTCSAPHSDKSNDSSDIDSVHSLPIDTDHININTEHLNASHLNLPISYADIAKNSNSLDRPKWNRPPSERKIQQNKICSMDKNLNKCESVIPVSVKPIETPESCNAYNTEIHQEKLQLAKSNNIVIQSVQGSKLNNFDNIVVDKINTDCIETTQEESNCLVIKNLPPDVQNWPAIQNYNNSNNLNNKLVLTNRNNRKAVYNKNTPSNNIRNNFKNAHNKTEKILQQHFNSNVINMTNNSITNNIHVETAVHLIQNTDHLCVNNVHVLPHNIPDVQTIEKMHFKQLQEAMQQQQQQHPAANNSYIPHSVHEIISNHVPQNNYIQNLDHQASTTITGRIQCVVNEVRPISVISTLDNCDSERTSSRPAVVILSGDTKEIAGITFGFDINEQLLSDDVCDNFTARFYVPDIFQNHNHDKIVNFIGLAWEDTVNQANGKVTYFSDL